MCKCTHAHGHHEEEALHSVKKGVVRTMEYICERRDRNDMKYYTSQQLDDLKDCMDILRDLHKIQHYHSLTAPMV